MRLLRRPATSRKVHMVMAFLSDPARPIVASSLSIGLRSQKVNIRRTTSLQTHLEAFTRS